MKKREIVYKSSEENKGKKISDYLIELGYPQSALTRLRHTPGSIWVGGKEVHMNYVMEAETEFTVVIREEDSSDSILPVELPFRILYEDDDILVVNKLAGMPIHPTGDNKENTLANAVAFYYAQKGESFVFRCVNRLDKDTSGITILAKHYLAAGILAGQMKGRKIKREYWAIVSAGQGVQRELPDSGTVDAGIARLGERTIERIVDDENGERAITHYTVQECVRHKTKDGEKDFLLVHCVLETGRTHQIRVHMKYLGYPLIGDAIYNPSEHSLNRQALHAGRITFMHPIRREEMCFDTSLEKDMSDFLWQSE